MEAYAIVQEHKGKLFFYVHNQEICFDRGVKEEEFREVERQWEEFDRMAAGSKWQEIMSKPRLVKMTMEFLS